MISQSSLPQYLTVWVVEDSDEYRQTIQDLIEEQEGLRCPHTFVSGEALLDHLHDHFAPEVVLMDIGLPGMSGIEAVDQLTRISPGTRVVMLTIHEDNDRIFKALCGGASGYLLKTARPEEVVDAVYEVSRGGAPLTSQIARRVLSMFTQLNRPREDYGLTAREKDVLVELVAGKSKKGIAKDLARSIHTVDTHLRNIYAKLHVHSKSGAVAKAIKDGVV